MDAMPDTVGMVRRLAGPRLAVIRLIPQAGWAVAGALLMLNVILGVLPVVFVISTSVIVGRVRTAASSGPISWHLLGPLLVLTAVVFMAQMLLGPLQAPLGELMARRVDGKMFRRLMTASLASPTIAVLEDSEVLNELAEASRELEYGFQSPGRACTGMLALVARYLQLAGFTAAIGLYFSWLAAAGVLVVVMLFRYGHRGGERRYTAILPDLAPRLRKHFYLRRLGTDAFSGKEIRVFGLIDWLRECHREAYLSWMLPLWNKRHSVYLGPFVVFTLVGLGITGTVMAMLGAATASHTISLAHLALVIQAIVGAIYLGTYYPEADTQTQLGTNAIDATARFENKVGQRADHGRLERSAAGIKANGPTLAERIESAERVEFADITFRYPGSRRQVLDGLSLTVSTGMATALVGLNGAGKTTLIKLLARLYRPDSGAIRINGIEISESDTDEWHRKIGICFQDYLHYEASLADNIGYGAIEHISDRPGIVSAATQAGLDSVIASLPHGIDTPLARHMRDGAELSGGQWQRVALARSLFALRHGASILVLDEPTAHLDVRAEARFYEEFMAMTRGVTTILISHRFAGVRLADRIVLLADGKVAEDGSHEQLLEQGGRYAELFNLQAARFTESDNAAGQNGRAGSARGAEVSA